MAKITKNKERPVLLVDTREKQPFDFSSDDAFESVKYTKLDAGDYTIEGLEHIISIERKGSVDELYLNFSKDKDRILAEFDRLKNHKIKIILIEESCEDVLNPLKYYINKKGINKHSPKMPVAVVISNLIDLLLQQNVHIMFGGSKSQSILRGILLRAYELHQKNKL